MGVQIKACDSLEEDVVANFMLYSCYPKGSSVQINDLVVLLHTISCVHYGL